MNAAHRRRILVSLAATLLFVAGCGEEYLPTNYGERSGDSVNGTAVLGDMFEQAGHTVTTWRTLSPRLRRADTIVWFPDDFSPPSYEVRAWFEDWLEESPGRTLIYVGRDYDSAPTYWKKVSPGTPVNLTPEVARRLTQAEARAASDRAAIPKPDDFDWFALETGKPLTARSLGGPWSQNVDASKVEIELNSRLVPPSDAEVLLDSNGETVVSRQSFTDPQGWTGGDSQLIVVSNGSFLLNLPLLNHEHRKLAGKLIAESGQPGRTVFLESSAGGPQIRAEDPTNAPPTGLEIFNIWPMSFILLHIAAVGIVFCAARYPIFGTPRDPPAASRSDFGRHIRALGELLQMTRDRAYATARLKHYHQNVRGESVKGRRDTK